MKSQIFPIPKRLSSDRISLFLLVIAVLSLFGPILLHPAYILFPTFSPFSDIMVIHWPKARLIAQSWAEGHGLPYWNPLILSGMPLAANQLAMLFYPPAWLFLIGPLEPVFNLLFIFHFLGGGLGVYFWLRKAFNLSASAALLGSLTFALNGKWLAHAAGGHVSMVGAIAWTPWVLLGLHMLLGGGRETGLSRKKWVGLAAVALAMQILTHTLLFLYTAYLIAAIVAWHFIFIRTKDRISEIKRLFLPLLLIPLLAVLLGAVQLLPLLELAQFSNRTFTLEQAAEFALSPIQLVVGLLLPAARGGHELVIYAGLVPLVLAPLGLSRRNRWSWFYGLLVVFCLLFALGPGTPLHSLFYHFAPGFSWVRTPARIFFIGALALAALVGLASDRLSQKDWSPAAQRWLTRLVVAISGLALMTGLGLGLGFGQLNRATVSLAVIVPLNLVVILLLVRQMISRSLAITLLGLLLFVDLASFDISMMRFVPPAEALAPGRTAAEYLAQKEAYVRIYSPSYSLPMQTAAAANLHLADGVEPVHLAIYDRYMARAGGYNDPGFSVTIPNFGQGPLQTALQETRPDLKLLGLLNVAYLASDFPMTWPGLTLETKIGDAYIYRNEQALPRAWVAHQAISAQADWLDQLASLPNPANVVILEDNGSLAPSPSKGGKFGSPPPNGGRLGGGLTAVNFQHRPKNLSIKKAAGPAAITHYSSDLIEIETELAEPGWLVLSEIWYPGWQAKVNGIPQPVERVNGLLRGIYLAEPGPYRIELAYRPDSVIVGSWISGLTLGLLFLFFAGYNLVNPVNPV